MKHWVISFFMFQLILLLSQSGFSQGNLLITPHRIVFEGNRQTEEINLANTGQDSAAYTISFVQYRMKEDGSFEQISKPDTGQLFADKYVRFFPRRVYLAPGEAQVVRMQVRRRAGMQNGEYRSHLYFRSVPQEKPLGRERSQSKDTTGIGISLTPIFGITIPVIIRRGDPDVSLDITDIKLDTTPGKKPKLSFVFNRSGNRSVYGELIVEYENQNVRPLQVGIVKGISVYTPNKIRKFSMELNQPEGVDFNTGKLIITYVEKNQKSGVDLTREFNLE